MAMMCFEPRYRREPRWSPWSHIFDLDAAVWDEFSRRHGAALKRRCCGDRPAPATKKSCCRRSTPAEPEVRRFRAELDTAGFLPDDVTVHRRGDVVTVRARRHDGGVRCHMFQRLRLPDNAQSSRLTAHVTRSGQLVLEAQLVPSRTPGQAAVTCDTPAGQQAVEKATAEMAQPAAQVAVQHTGSEAECNTAGTTPADASSDREAEAADRPVEVITVYTESACDGSVEVVPVPVQRNHDDVTEPKTAAEDAEKQQTDTEDTTEDVTSPPQRPTNEDSASGARDVSSAAGDQDTAVPVPMVCERVQDDTYCVSADVAHFRPDEVTVKVTGRFVTVQAEHEESCDGGVSSMRLVRRFILPEGVYPDLVTSRLTPAGQLVVEAPRSLPDGSVAAP